MSIFYISFIFPRCDFLSSYLVVFVARRSLDSAKKQNHKGQLPLHLACECATDIDVFLEIYKYNDDVVKAKDENGMLW